MQIIVPVKKFADAKSRLGDVLSPSERSRLAEALAWRVLGQLSMSHRVDRVIVASSEPSMKDAARRFGFELLLDAPSSPGLNNVVDRAVAYAVAAGGTDIGVVFSDLPLFEIDEFDRILDSHIDGAARQVTLVADRWESGTNVRLFRPGNLLPSMYGPGSVVAYRNAALSHGIDVAVVESRRLSHDLDHADDLQALFEIRKSPGYDFPFDPFLGTEVGVEQRERPAKCA